MPDVILKCVDCGADFTFTDRDQQFYKEKGFDQPKRCKGCRAAKKQRQRDDRNA